VAPALQSRATPEFKLVVGGGSYGRATGATVFLYCANRTRQTESVSSKVVAAGCVGPSPLSP
jgi:hypothetical protein